MNYTEQFLTAVGLSMDAFAVAICIGLTLRRFSFGKALIVGLYFGIFQAVMPIIGYFLAAFFAEHINAYAHWIAFGVLGILGGRMVFESFKKDDTAADGEMSLGLSKMLPFAFATSIDAMAVGVTFAALRVNIAVAVVLIGVITLIVSVIGVKIGNVFGVKFKKYAEIAGGVILILIGAKILLEAIVF
jgi:putative Mn2+ efflux pump MntP